MSSHSSSNRECNTGLAVHKLPVVRLVFALNYYPDIHIGVSRAANELGWILDDAHCTCESIPYLGEPDAILLSPGGITGKSVETLKEITPSFPTASSAPSAFGIPMVCMLLPLHRPDQSLVCPAVLLDWREAGRMAARHLCSLRLPHLAYWRSGYGNDANLLWDAFCSEAKVLQKEPEEWCIDTEFSTRPFNCFSSKGRLWLQGKLLAAPKPLAIMAADDRFAYHIIQAALDVGLKVPEEVAVMGAENIRSAQLKSPVSISTIDLNMEELGYRAAYILSDQLRNNKIDQFNIKTIPINRLIERKSTLTFSHSDPKIVAAALKIRSDYTNSISVTKLARELGLSPQLLHKKYLSATGKSISQEIRIARLAAAAALLKETDIKTEAIAIEVGLKNSRTFFRLFKEHYGMTPGLWRKSIRS